jgi:hypothetical protein
MVKDGMRINYDVLVGGEYSVVKVRIFQKAKNIEPLKR